MAETTPVRLGPKRSKTLVKRSGKTGITQADLIRMSLDNIFKKPDRELLNDYVAWRHEQAGIPADASD